MKSNVYGINELTGATRCAFRRKHDLGLTKSKTDPFKRSVILKSVLSDYYNGNLLLQDLEDRVRADFESLHYSKKQRELKACDAVKELKRYIKSETRTPVQAPGVEQVIDIFGTKIKVRPDFIFSSGNVIEIVMVKASKPQANINPETDMGLYAMLCYGRLVAKSGVNVIIRASYYYLRKKTDVISFSNPQKNNFEADFFNGGNNVVTIEEGYCKGAPGLTRYDQLFQPLFEELRTR